MGKGHSPMVVEEKRGWGGGRTQMFPRGVASAPGRGEGIRSPPNCLRTPSRGQASSTHLPTPGMRGPDFNPGGKPVRRVFLNSFVRGAAGWGVGLPGRWPPLEPLTRCRPETGSPHRELPGQRRRLRVRRPPRFPHRARSCPATSPRATPSRRPPPPEPYGPALTSAPPKPKRTTCGVGCGRGQGRFRLGTPRLRPGR